MNDETIIDLYLGRKESAITETKEKYGKSIRRIVKNAGLDAQEAEEIENDTYYALWNSIPPHKPYDYFFPYILKIAREKAFSLIRSKTSTKRNADIITLSDEMEECIHTESNVEKELDKKALSNSLNTFVNSLKEDKRNIFLRRYWFMDSISDIANRYGISEGKVKSVLFRVRNQLKLYLEKEGF